MIPIILAYVALSLFMLGAFRLSGAADDRDDPVMPARGRAA